MANQFQDIIPPKKRSIRDIPLPEGRERPDRPTPPPPPLTHRPKAEPEIKARPSPVVPPREEVRIKKTPEIRPNEEIVGPRPIDSPPDLEERSERDPYWRAGLWLLALIALIFLFFGVSYLFAGANIKVIPHSQDVTVNQTINADPNGSGGTMPYAVITLEKTGSKDVTANGTQNVANKASGEIIIYNNYSSSPQSLVATTRFETPEGLVFRIDKDITVPGQSTVNGQVTAGSVEATVYADQAGEEYNVGLKDFTIPGFKGTPKYQGFYARSKTPITGGFIGTTATASAADIATAKTQIEADLRNQFITQANSQKPDDFILYPDALTITYSPAANSTSTTQKLTVRESATAYAVLFNRNILAKYFQDNLSVNYSSSTLAGIENLKFSFTNPNGFQSTASSSADFTFKLEGTLKLVSLVDI